jgi:hypothetical protein
MRRLALVLALMCLLPPAARAQRLAARPVLYEDPVPTGSWQDRPLVLGRTLLQSARLMFPDAPQVFTGYAAYSINHGNPQPIDRYVATWTIGGATLTPKYIFQLGDGNWMLYFDEHQRLIHVGAPPGTGEHVTRTSFARHYPTLRETRRGETYIEMEASLRECVTLSAVFDLSDRLRSYGYSYTCPTAEQPSP